MAASTSQAASFDCGKRLNQVETLICADAELSRQDESLSLNYGAAIRRADGARQAAIRRDERQWISHRVAACAFSDIDNEANRAAATRCIFSDTARRIEALRAMAAAPAPAAPAGRGGADEYRRGDDDVLQLADGDDGRAGVAILAGNARGVCDVELDGRRIAPGRYLFTEAETGCSVSVEVTGNAAAVDSSGACQSFCGVHAPGFTGMYLRKPGPRAASNKN